MGKGAGSREVNSKKLSLSERNSLLLSLISLNTSILTSRLPGLSSSPLLAPQERLHSCSRDTSRSRSRSETPYQSSMALTEMPTMPQKNLVTITLDIDCGTVEFVK